MTGRDIIKSRLCQQMQILRISTHTFVFSTMKQSRVHILVSAKLHLIIFTNKPGKEVLKIQSLDLSACLLTHRQCIDCWKQWGFDLKSVKLICNT